MTMDLVWMIIVVVLMGVLPDLLRRKRRYPRSKGPIPVPPRRKPAPAPKMEAPEPTVPEPSFPDWDEGWDNMNFPDEPEPALPKKMAPPRVAAERPRPVPVVVPQRVRPAAWSGLTPQAKELYAGFVWSEIWQEPLAHRKGFIKK